MLFDKETVDRFLSINTKNRNVSMNHVLSMSRMMKNGTFFGLNGQTIVVNKSHTRLIDGQHRLLAMRMAGYPRIEINVVEIDDELAQAAFDTIDINHNARTTGQIMQLKGLENARTKVAIVNTLAALAWCRYGLCAEEVRKLIDDLHDEIEMSHCRTNIIGRITPVSSITAGVVNAMLIKKDKKDEIEKLWVSVLKNMIDPNHTALRHLLSMICLKEYTSRTEAFFKTTKALLNPNLGKLLIKKNEDVANLKCAPLI